MPEIIEAAEWLKIPKNSVNSRKINKISGCSYLTNRRRDERYRAQTITREIPSTLSVREALSEVKKQRLMSNKKIIA